MKLFCTLISVFLFYSLPLPVQQSLLLDLLYLSLDMPADVTSHTNLVLGTLTPHALFAVTLYHRWLLRALVYSELKAKEGPGSIPGTRPTHNGNLK